MNENEKENLVFEVTKKVETELVERLDDRYVRHDSCDRRQDDVYKKIESMGEKISCVKITVEKLNTKLGILLGLLGAIGTGVLTICLKLLFGG